MKRHVIESLGWFVAGVLLGAGLTELWILVT